jgi:putative component of toxin-antitoxin plasmid stabilization module
LRDYSKFKITVRGEPTFASFFQSLRDEELKERIDGVLSTLKEHPDAGDLVEGRCGPTSTRRWSSPISSG